MPTCLCRSFKRRQVKVAKADGVGFSGVCKAERCRADGAFRAGLRAKAAVVAKPEGSGWDSYLIFNRALCIFGSC